MSFLYFSICFDQFKTLLETLIKAATPKKAKSGKRTRKRKAAKAGEASASKPPKQDNTASYVWYLIELIHWLFAFDDLPCNMLHNNIASYVCSLFVCGSILVFAYNCETTKLTYIRVK